MICKFCNYQEERDALFCSDCGEPFYIFKYPSLVYFTYGKIKFTIDAENRGVENLKLISTHLESITINNRHLIPIGQNQVQQIPQESKWNTSTPMEANPHFTVQIGTKTKIIRYSSLLKILPHPNVEFEIADTWEVSNFTGFSGEFLIKVINNSALNVVGVRFEEVEIKEDAELLHLDIGSSVVEEEENLAQTWSIVDIPSSTASKETDDVHTDIFDREVFVDSKTPKNIKFSFPKKHTYGVVKYRIYLICAPVDSGLIVQNLSFCECTVKYKRNPEISFAVEKWTSKGFASIVYLEMDEKLLLGAEDTITPRNYQDYGLARLNTLFSDLSKSVYKFNVPIGEERIRRIKPIVYHRDEIGIEELMVNFPCKITINCDRKFENNVFFREVPSNGNKNQFNTIHQPLFLSSLISSNWLELLFNVDRVDDILLTIRISFSPDNSIVSEYSREFVVKVYPYHPFELDEPIAIDFGTTNSCIAFDFGKKLGKGKWQSDGVIDCLPVDFFHPQTTQNTNILPSILSYESKSEQTTELIPVVPDTLFIPGEICSNFKIDFIKEFNANEAILHSKFDKSYEEQIYDYFRVLLERIKISLEDREIFATVLTHLILTVPNNFTGGVREKYVAIIQRLIENQKGIKSRIFLPAPQDESLAVINHALETQQMQVEDNTVFGVIDFGGGTTDITFIYSIDNKVFLVSTGGSAHFGGTTIDKWYFARFLENPAAVGDSGDWELSNLNPTLRGVDLNELDPDLRFKLSKLKWHLGNEKLLYNKTKSFIDEANGSSRVILSDQWKEDKFINDCLITPFVKALKEKVSILVNDGLGRAASQQVIFENNEKPRLVLFLAGNGSKIFGFKEVVEAAIANNFKDKFRDFNVVRLSKPKEAVALGARAFYGEYTHLDRKTCGPPNSYYYKIGGILPKPNAIYLQGVQLIPIIVDGDAKNAKDDCVTKEFDATQFQIDHRRPMQILEKSGIDYNELNIRISGTPPFKKIRFILNSNGVLAIEGIN